MDESPLIEPAYWENPESPPQETTLPLGTIISKVVSQCAEAQQAAANSMWEYLREAAFIRGKERTEMVFVQLDFESYGKKLKVRLPLISIIPIQYIQIRDVEIDFSVALDEEQATKVDESATRLTPTLAKRSLSRLARTCPVRLAPSVKQIKRTQNSNYSLKNHINVKIKAGNLDMSGGMARLLELAGSRGIRITSPEEEAET